jgi:hypothetical protein
VCVCVCDVMFHECVCACDTPVLSRVWDCGISVNSSVRQCYREASCTIVLRRSHKRPWSTRWRSWLRHCAASRKVAGSIPDGVTRILLAALGVATSYGLDGPGIESRWGRDFPHLSTPALGPTQPCISWVPGLIPRDKAVGAWR